MSEMPKPQKSFWPYKHLFKSPYGQKRFLGLCIFITSKKCIQTQKSEFRCFLPSNYRFGHAQWIWLRNGRLVTNDVTSGTSESSKFHVFISLAWRLYCFTNFNLFVFCWGKPLITTETTVTWTGRISWFPTRRHDLFRNPDSLFCTDSRSSSLGVAEAGTLKLDLRALKSQNPIYFLRMPFYTL